MLRLLEAARGPASAPGSAAQVKAHGRQDGPQHPSPRRPWGSARAFARVSGEGRAETPRSFCEQPQVGGSRLRAGPARLSALERLIMQTRRSLSIIHRRLRLAEGSGQGDSAGRRTGPRGSARGRPAGRPLGSSCLGPAGGAGGGARPRPSRTAFLHPGLQASSPGCWSPQQEKLVCWFPERTFLCLRPPQPLVPQPPGPGRSLEKVELGPAGAAPATSLPARAPSPPPAARPLSLPGAPLLPAISSPTPRRAGQGTGCRDHSRAPELAAAGGADRCGWGKPRSGWRSALLPGT